jgi:TPR repeat protein
MGGHRKEAARQFELSRPGGYGAASYVLSELARLGVGVPKDEARSNALMREAAMRGIPEAMYRLGDYYRYGEGGVQQDVAQAQAWYERAGNAGLADGYSAIGDLLESVYPKFLETPRGTGAAHRAARGGARTSSRSCTKAASADASRKTS